MAVVAGTMPNDERIHETVNMPMVKQARGQVAQVAQETVQDNEKEIRGKTKYGTEQGIAGFQRSLTVLEVSTSDEVFLCHTPVRPNLLQNPWFQPAADIVNRGERATGGECLGVRPSHDCQLEVAVDEFARAATPAEQTRSGSSWSAMRRLCLQEAIPQTATLVGSR